MSDSILNQSESLKGESPLNSVLWTPRFLKRALKSLSFLSLCFLFAGPEAFAEPQKGSLILSAGVYTDRKIPNAPSSIALDGEFRKLTKVQYNANTKVLRFYPKKEGVGTVIVKNKKTGKILYQLTIDVRKTNLRKVAREIQSFLKNIEGIAIRIINNKVVVDGQILIPNDMKRIHSVVKQYGGTATSLVTLSPVAQNKIAQFIERKINNPEIQVNAVNGKFILEGVANDQAEKDRSEIIAKMYVPDIVVDEAVADKKVLEIRADKVINLIAVRPPPASEPAKIIQMVVHFVELQKDYSKGFRFQWTPTLADGSNMQFAAGGRTPSSMLGTISGTISNLLPKLNWAKQHGMARVLQSTSITVQAGKKGMINSTTNVPYPVVTDRGTGTQFEPTGIRTTITPDIMGARSDSVKLEMAFSVKALLSLTGAGPVISNKEVQTTLHVKSGQSAAVGGLISSESSTGFNRPTGLPANPILSLYASKQFQRNQSQFVVFVTPIIKSSASAGSERIKRKFRLPK